MERSSKTLNPEKWVDLYGDALFSYALKRVLNQVIAEDIVQETFLAALKSMERFRGQSSEKTWLFAILKNKIVDHFRKIKTQREDQVNFAMPFKDSGLFYKHWLKDKGPKNWNLGPGDSLESADFKRIFEYCLSVLPPKLAAVFALKIIEECESDEICKEIGITASNFWVSMHRARLRLRECMEHNWLDEVL